MIRRAACTITVLVACLVTIGCGDTESGDSGDEGRPSSASTGVPYNDEDNDGQAPAEG